MKQITENKRLWRGYDKTLNWNSTEKCYTFWWTCSEFLTIDKKTPSVSIPARFREKIPETSLDEN